MSYSLSSAALADAPAIRSLVNHVIDHSFGDDEALRLDVRGNVNGNIDLWLAKPDEHVVLKACADGALVGMVQVKNFWNLCSLYVHPSFQRRGIGEALLESACAACKDLSPRDAILLNAAPRAVAFYQRLGFTEREAKRPLPPGAMAMQRPL